MAASIHRNRARESVVNVLDRICFKKASAFHVTALWGCDDHSGGLVLLMSQRYEADDHSDGLVPLTSQR